MDCLGGLANQTPSTPLPMNPPSIPAIIDHRSVLFISIPLPSLSHFKRGAKPFDSHPILHSYGRLKRNLRRRVSSAGLYYSFLSMMPRFFYQKEPQFIPLAHSSAIAWIFMLTLPNARNPTDLLITELGCNDSKNCPHMAVRMRLFEMFFRQFGLYLQGTSMGG